MTTVISRKNATKINDILEFARIYNTPILFQPAIKNKLGGEKNNPIVCEKDSYRKAINNVIRFKKKHYRLVANSFTGLAHLKNWPKYSTISCIAGQLSWRIDSKGCLYACERFSASNTMGSVIESKLEDLMRQTKSVNCRECWCANLVEANCLFRFNFESMINTIMRM